MLMKWLDLEPGDIIRYTDELRDFYNSTGFSWWTVNWCDTGLIVKEILICGESIGVHFIKYNGINSEVYIRNNGTGFHDFEGTGFFGVVFKIISLVGD